MSETRSRKKRDILPPTRRWSPLRHQEASAADRKEFSHLLPVEERGLAGADDIVQWPNLTGDPFFTDGMRMVLRLTDEPTSVEDVLVFDWDESPGSQR